MPIDRHVSRAGTGQFKLTHQPPTAGNDGTPWTHGRVRFATGMDTAVLPLGERAENYENARNDGLTVEQSRRSVKSAG